MTINSKEYMQEWRKNNKEKCKKNNKDWYAKNPWGTTLKSIRYRTSQKNSKGYHNYGGRGIKCLITAEELKKLWFRDKAYDLKRPSIDRIDNDGNYTFDNCRYIEVRQNASEGAKIRWDKIKRGLVYKSAILLPDKTYSSLEPEFNRGFNQCRDEVIKLNTEQGRG